MRSTKTIDEEDPEDTSINKTVDITNLTITGIEITVAPGKIYKDETGNFPVTSRKGAKYLFVLYCYGSNAIINESLNESTGR